MADSKSWDEFMAAIDSMTVPAQNVVIVDRAGNVGYRSSGTGVLRHAPGFAPGKAADLQWDGLAAAKDRPRKLLVNDGIDPLPVYIATANERVWVDKFGHYWDADDRKGRIAEYLKSSPDYVLSDMAALQLDTQATFSKLLLEWIIKKTSRRDDIANNLKASWAAWKGTIRENPLIFAQAQVAEESMRKLLIGRVFSQYFVGDTHTSVDKYSWGMDHAWFMALLEQANATKAFGTNDVEVADYLIQQVLNRTDLKPHQEGNRWAAQHPFVGRIPLIGSFFEVEAPLQLGAADVPMVERPRFGASVRFLWELSNPQASRWVIPVGQSGHIKSKWYQGFRQMWIKGQNTGVFPDSDQWAFRDPSTLKAY
jgi:penicillin amidase